MKTIVNVNIIAAAVFLVLVSGIWAQEGNQGVIRELSGTVEIKQPGSAVWETADRGQVLTGNTSISTSFKSSALISLGNALITVRPLTRLTLQELALSAETETINVSLQTGRVKVDLNPPSGTKTAMRVQSPVATASVRGTSFEFDAFNLEVFNGTVEFSGSSGTGLLIDEGRMGYVDDTTGRAVPPEISSAQELSPPLPFGTGALPPQGQSATPPDNDDGTGLNVIVDF